MAIVYDRRDEVVLELGYASYRHYLSSDLWRSIRKRVFERSRECKGCRGMATQVHHSQYTMADLTGKTLQNLYAVCDSCHKKAEYENGKKLTPVAATRRLKELRYLDRPQQPIKLLLGDGRFLTL